MIDDIGTLFSKEAEEAVLGAIIIDPEIISKVNLTPDDFYHLRNRILFSAMLSVDAIDIITLADHAKRDGSSDLVDIEYIISLTTKTPSYINAQYYAEQVREYANRRRLISIAESVAKGAFDTKSSIDKVISTAMTSFVKISDGATGAYGISGALDKLYSEIEIRLKDPKEIYGLRTGLIDFDKITAGLQCGEVIILSGVPGTGKSMLAAQLAVGLAKNGHSGAFYEMEMNDVSVVRRNLSAETGVPTKKMRTGNLTQYEVDEIKSKIRDLSALPIYLSDDTSWTTVGLRSDLARLKEEHGIQWFMVDYMDLLRDEYGDSTVDKSAFISMQLHAIAKDLDLAGLVIQSMNKVGLASAIPGKEHLSGSVKVSYDADQVIMMMNGSEEHSKPNDPDMMRYVTLIWDKMREGDGTNRSMTLIRLQGLPAFGCYQK